MATSAPPRSRLLENTAKKAAAFQAVADHLDTSHRYVGIGSGSTVVHVVEAIAAKGPKFSAHMSFVPTGSQSAEIIRSAGLKLCRLDERPAEKEGSLVPLDVAFDGADEVDDDLNCIKGGGACLLQEKLVAVAAAKFIIVADYRKLSSRLCSRWKSIPIEVLPLAAPDVLTRLRGMGSQNPTVRSGLPSKAGECVTDNGMWIIDAPFSPLLLRSDPKKVDAVASDASKSKPAPEAVSWEVQALAEELIRIPGVVEIGLFHGRGGSVTGFSQKPQMAYFGMEDGNIIIRK